MTGHNMELYLVAILASVFFILMVLCILMILTFECRRNLKKSQKEMDKHRKERRKSLDNLKKEVECVHTLIYVSGVVNKLCVNDENSKICLECGECKPTQDEINKKNKAEAF